MQHLRPVWMYQVQGRHHFETTPLVFDGVMYLTDPPSDVVALDVKTGRPLWTYRRSLPDDLRACCGDVNRGVAALGDQIFIATIDAHLVALDMRTGRVRWDVEVADYKTGHSLTAAPLAVKDKVIVGMAGAEYGVRGFLDAYDASDRQARVAPVDRTGAGRARPRDLERRQLEARRRDDVGDGRVRPRHQPDVLGNWQSGSRLHRRRSGRATTCTPIR